MPFISAGGPVFNGGTITKSLRVVGDNSDPLQVYTVTDTLLDLTSAGSLQVFPAIAQSAGDPVLEVGNQAAGNAFQANNNGTTVTGVTALATQQYVSGAGARVGSANVDTRTFTPVTFNPTAGAAATCVVAVSPTGAVYTTLWTETEPAGVAFDGTIHNIPVFVPGNWRLKLTVTNATIGLTTYY